LRIRDRFGLSARIALAGSVDALLAISGAISMICSIRQIGVAASWATAFVFPDRSPASIPWHQVIGGALAEGAQQLVYATVLRHRHHHPPLHDQEPPRWVVRLALASLALALAGFALVTLIL
jgi:hypothetical protein